METDIYLFNHPCFILRAGGSRVPVAAYKTRNSPEGDADWVLSVCMTAGASKDACQIQINVCNVYCRYAHSSGFSKTHPVDGDVVDMKMYIVCNISIEISLK